MSGVLFSFTRTDVNFGCFKGSGVLTDMSDRFGIGAAFVITYKKRLLVCDHIKKSGGYFVITRKRRIGFLCIQSAKRAPYEKSL